MTIVWILLLLVFLLCFLIYQWWFEQSRSRNMSEARKSRTKFYNRPAAWALYSIVVFLIILSLISFQIMGLMENIMKLNR